jgi:hypothetical protein
MSTLGFGDLHPMNDFERILCIFIFIIGNGTFAVIIQDIVEMIEIFKDYDKENDDGERLNKFFNLLVRYNRRMPIDDTLRRNIETLFTFRW